MAIYNEILVGRYARMLQKLFGIKGTVPAKQLAGEITPAFPLFSGTEHRYLEGWDQFSFNAAQGPIAATSSAFQIRNPANSNVIAIIFKLIFAMQTGAADTMVISNASNVVDLAAAGTGSRLDPRGRASSTCIVSNSGANSDLVNGIATIGIPAAPLSVDFILFEEQELPILPGDTYRFRQVAQNVGNRMSILWRERFLEESERT